MPTPEQLQEENERLRAELASYKETEQINRNKKGQFIKWLNNISSWFFLGGDLKQSIKKLVIEVRDKDKQLSNDTLGDVLAHGVWRFTRIGCFTIALALVPVSILITQTVLFYHQNQKIDIQNNLVEKQNEKIDAQNIRLDQQTNLQEAERRSSLVFLFSNIMDAVDRELRDSTNNPQRKLSSQLQGRIIALSASLKPYRYLDEGDTLISTPLSPERGQLLINLVESKLHFETYYKIFQNANFKDADLKGVNLKEAYLEGADLYGADLSKADLSRAYLRNVDLRKADLFGANLNDACIDSAYLIHADLRKASLIMASLKKSFLVHANLEKTTLVYANLFNANLIGVKLHEANLKGANLCNAKTSFLDLLEDIDKVFPANEDIKETYYVDSTSHSHYWGKYYRIKCKSK